MKQLLILILSLYAVAAASQPTNKYVNGQTGISPTAAAFAKYGDIPVSYYTGTPDISIPIHTLTEGPISHSVSLSYHAGGIRVEETASRVGLGWNLNAGGMVSRVVNGLPDDAPTGYYNFATQLSNLSITNIAQGNYDTEPDIFSYYAGNWSGQFYVDINLTTGAPTVIQVPQQDVKIEFGFTTIKITTPDGNVYHYGSAGSVSAIDRTLSLSSNSFGVPDYKSAWHLIKIVSYDGLYTMNFEYEPDRYSFTSAATGQYFSINCGNGTSQGPQYTSTLSYLNVIGGNSQFHHYVMNYVDGNRLKKITTSLETVNFNSNTTRTDLSDYNLNGLGTNKKRLDEITVVSGLSGEYCKKFEFKYNYLTDAAHSSYAEGQRLKLESVQEMSCQATPTITIPKYTFTYNTTALPWRLSRAIDSWGYYNGATSNENLYVNIPPTSVQWPNGSYTNYGSANRTPSATYMQAGALRRITYPTGGYTEFTFEPHTYAVSCYPLPAAQAGEQPGFRLSTDAEYLAGAFNEAKASRAFSREELANGEFLLAFSKPDKAKTIDNLVELEVLKGSVTIANYGFNVGQKELAGKDSFSKALPTEIIALLQSDTAYTFQLRSKNGIGEFTFEGMGAGGSLPTNTAGGLRIQQIKTHDGRSASNDIYRTYSYGSGGYMFWAVVHGLYTGAGYLMTSGGALTGYGAGVVMSSGSVIPSSTFSGNHIGYPSVTEYYNQAGNATANGYTQYSFNIGCPYYPATTYPAPPYPYNVSNGAATTTAVYNSSSTQEQTTSLGYNNLPYSSGASYSRFSPNFEACSNTLFFISTYSNGTSAPRVSSMTITKDGVSVSKTFTYGAKHLAPIVETTTNSDGKSYSTETSYPHDLASGTDIYANLRDRNLLIPVRTYDKVNGTTVSGTQTLFAYWNNTPYPQYYQNYEVDYNYSTNAWSTSGSWVTQGTVNSMDLVYGQPKTFTLDGWSVETYTWTTGGLLQSRKYNTHQTAYNYHPGTRLLSGVVNVDGTTTSYGYDLLMRLNLTTDNCRNVSTGISYTYNATSSLSYITTTTTYPAASNSDLSVLSNREYYDGLGRPIQKVKIGQGTSNPSMNIVMGTDYDAQGRVEFEFLPYEFSNTGSYTDPASAPWWPKKTTAYAPSALNRVSSETLPSWAYPTTYSYGKNASTINGYSANTLNVTTVTDGNNNFTKTYFDKLGRKVVDEQGSAGGTLKTFSAYDEKGRLRYVLPPGTNSSATHAIYSYEYYKNDLVSKKKVPDQDYIEYRYSNKDLLIHYQDGMLRAQGKWYANQYDDLGRITIFGFATTPLANNSSYLPSITTANRLGQNLYGSLTDPLLKDKLVRTEHRLLNPDGTLGTVYLNNYLYYDGCGRVQREEKNTIQNFSTASEKFVYSYDGADNITFTDYQHTVGMQTESVDITRTIDFAGRPKKTYWKLNTGANYEISDVKFNATGQVWYLNLGKTPNSYLQTVAHTYLPNTFLKVITSGMSNGLLFHHELFYDAPTANSNGTIQKNGNISQTITRVKSDDAHSNGYQYDQYGRLLYAYHRFFNAQNGVTQSDRFFTAITYDERGNIATLSRTAQYESSPGVYSSGNIDHLTYSYASIGGVKKNAVNTLVDNGAAAIKDLGAKGGGSTPFQYDANGNMTFDPGRNMTVAYNHLNLPRLVTVSGQSIEFTYDAGGRLLRKRVLNGTTVLSKRDYVGFTEYQDNVMVQVNHDHGRIAKNGSAWIYEFDIKDHLGNTRVTFADLNGDNILNYNTEILDENHYFPFGLRQEGAWNQYTGSSNKYLYNGKELHEDLGFNMYNYGKRFYDPTIGRFIGVDPRADKYHAWSPYHFVLGNPIRNIDPQGDTIRISGATGSFDWMPGASYSGNDAFIAQTSSALNALTIDPSTTSFTFYTKDRTSVEGNAVLDYVGEGSLATKVITIKEGNAGDSHHASGTVYWMPTEGIQMENYPKGLLGSVPPMAILLHEMGHGWLEHTYGDAQLTILFADEEQMLIDRLESKASEALGFGRRNNHFNVRSDRQEALIQDLHMNDPNFPATLRNNKTFKYYYQTQGPTTTLKQE